MTRNRNLAEALAAAAAPFEAEEADQAVLIVPDHSALDDAVQDRLLNALRQARVRIRSIIRAIRYHRISGRSGLPVVTRMSAADILRSKAASQSSL